MKIDLMGRASRTDNSRNAPDRNKPSQCTSRIQSTVTSCLEQRDMEHEKICKMQKPNVAESAVIA